MRITVKRRAEVALRSLSQREQGQLSRAINELTATSQEDFYHHAKLRKLISANGENLYTFRGNQSLRMVLSATDDSCTIEDILDHDRLKQLLPGRGKQLLPSRDKHLLPSSKRQ